MNISNHRPSEVTLTHTPIATGDINDVSYEFTKNILVDNLVQPLNQNYPVTLVDDNGNPCTNDDVARLIYDYANTTIDDTTEVQIKSYFASVLKNYTETFALPASAVFLNQALTKNKMGEPTSTYIYIPQDVIDVSKNFLTGNATPSQLFANLCSYNRTSFFGVYFRCTKDFDDFKAWLKARVSTMATQLDPQTLALFDDFQNVKLKSLFEDILLRNAQNPEVDDLCFARLLVMLVGEYVNSQPDDICGFMVPSTDEMMAPETLMFINVEEHALATPRQITYKWNQVTLAKAHKPIIIKNSKIHKLTANINTANNLKNNIQKLLDSERRAKAAARARKAHFSKTRPTSKKLLVNIIKTINKMGRVARSQNPYKTTSKSFMRPNRRHPDDFNLMGTSHRYDFKPDIHLYVDTSGSISEENYESAVKMCVSLAKKLNVNLYFTSFSSIMSQTTLVPCKGRSEAAIYKYIQKIPKVSGGTDFEQIWVYINQSQIRKHEFSLMITDFEYYPYNNVPHPKNLYYVPCSAMNWSYMVNDMTSFVKNMTPIEKNIRSHILV